MPAHVRGQSPSHFCYFTLLVSPEGLCLTRYPQEMWLWCAARRRLFLSQSRFRVRWGFLGVRWRFVIPVVVPVVVGG